MYTAELFIIARALHVLAVVLWIGGVAFVTTVLLPSLLNLDDSVLRLEWFERFEAKFALQAKLTTLTTGITGFYLLEYLNAWQRYTMIEFWWLHLMTAIWALFSVILFIVEPLFGHVWFERQVKANNRHTLIRLHRLHILLLSLSILAVVGAVMGAHGFRFS